MENIIDFQPLCHTEDNINLMKRYFESISYVVNIDVFDLSTYQFRFPDYFKNQEKITEKDEEIEVYSVNMKHFKKNLENSKYF